MAHRISLGGLKIQFFCGGLNSYSEEMVAMLREGKEQLLIDAQTNYGK